MLDTIHLKNYLFFEDTTVSLNSGLNIITGETGAGKSIIVNAIKVACGSRSKSNLHLDCNKPVSVCLCFRKIKQSQKKILKKIDFFCDSSEEKELEEIMIRRSISSSNNSKYFINDVLCTQKLVKEVAHILIEFTSQSNALRLFDSSYQLEILDSFLKGGLLGNLEVCYYHYQSCKRKFDLFLKEIENSLKEEDYLRFVAQELEALDPKEGEEEDLLDKIKLMKKHKNCVESITNIDSQIDKIRSSIHIISKQFDILEINEASKNKQIEYLDCTHSHLEELASEHRDFTTQFSKISENHSLEDLEERLHLLRQHSRKHRVMVCELPQLLSEIHRKLEGIKDTENLKSVLEQKLEKSEFEYIKCAKEIHKFRLHAAEELERSVNLTLKELNMEAALFRVKIVRDETKFFKKGQDSIVFEIRSNLGKEYENLSEIASGGELSRIMLAIKSNIKTQACLIQIFDEIDTGIGGAVSTLVGKKLKSLSYSNQLIVITHQPQVAVFADQHFVVSKSSNIDKTEISFLNLKGEEQLNEIARMLSGKVVNSASRAAAKSLISQI